MAQACSSAFFVFRSETPAGCADSVQDENHSNEHNQQHHPRTGAHLRSLLRLACCGALMVLGAARARSASGAKRVLGREPPTGQPLAYAGRDHLPSRAPHCPVSLLGRFASTDHGASMRFSAAVTDRITAPDAVMGVPWTPSRTAAFNAAKGGSAADGGILARGIVAPRHGHVALPVGGHSRGIVRAERYGCKAKSGRIACFSLVFGVKVLQELGSNGALDVRGFQSILRGRE